MTSKKNINISSLFIRVVMYFLLFLFVLFALLHVPAIQSFITNRVIQKLTENVEGKVSIESAQLNIYEGVVVNGILISGTENDTLLTAQYANISPRSTLLALVNNDLSLNDISLRGVDVYLRRSEQDESFNWQKFIGENQNKRASNNQAPDIDLSSIRIGDFSIKIDDFKKKEFTEMSFSSFEIDINDMSLDSIIELDISRILLLRPQYSFTFFEDEGVDEIVEKKESANIAPDFPIFRIGQLVVIDGNYRSARRLAEDLVVEDADLNISDFTFQDINNWRLRLNELSGRTQRDEISFGAIEGVVNENGSLNIDNAMVNINKSRLKFDASAQIGDLLNDLKYSNIKLELRPSIVYLNDAFTLIPDLERSFQNDPLATTRIQLGGLIDIINDTYTGKNLAVWVNGNHHFLGDIYFKQLPDFDQSVLNANVRQFRSNLADLSKLSEKFVIPKDLERLEDIEFVGSFDGYLNDFVASGELESPLGHADLDIKFDLSGEGEESILYQGFLSLDSFDLRGMTLNEDFGYVDATIDITNGKGRSLSQSSADIDANIERFEFKDFQYKNAVYNGQLSSRALDGQFRILDDELQFQFDGMVDFRDSLPVFNFRIVADKINFCQLNITNFPCELSFASDINLRGNSISNLSGNAVLQKVNLTHDSTHLGIEDIVILSQSGEESNKFSLRSDYVDLSIEGRFNLLQVANHTIDQIVKNIDGHNQVWNYSFSSAPEIEDRYKYNLQLKNATSVFKFFNVNIEQEGIAHINGNHDARTNELNFSASIPKLKYDNISSDSILIKLIAKEDDVELYTSLRNFKQGSRQVKRLNLNSVFNGEAVNWDLYYLFDEFNKASIGANSVVKDNGYFTKFNKNDILIDSVQWKIISNTGLGLFKDKLDIQNLIFSDGDRYVSFRDVNQRGLEISLNDFELNLINPLINYDKTIFRGTTDGRIRIDDVFSNRSLYGFIEVPDFTINGDDFGHLLIKAQRNLEKVDVVNLDLSIEKDTQNLYASGYFDIGESYLFTDISIEDYPMSFFEYIIEDGISETTGTTDISARIFGSLDDLKMSGEGFVKNGGVRVDYIGAYYRMPNERVTLDENFIDFTNVKLVDELDNTAMITGGLRHNLLADIRADLVIRSPQFIGLNTTYQDNPIYYGQGIGQLDVSFKGPFDAIDIVVNGTLEKLSRLSIPLLSNSYVYDESFIVFENEQDTLEEEKVETLADILKERGVDFELNLTFTPDAIITIIYDEATSNVLEGTGEGNIKLEVKRDGAFNAYGDYTITSGRYLYTAYGFIAKPFIIRSGGTVSWTGDPLNANLNVVADHSGLRAPLTNFLAEYIGSSGITETELSFSREIELKLLLNGTLFNPTVNFDIDFPNLTGQLRTLAQNKVRTLRSTENGINNQVVGLLLFRNFLPDNNGLAAVPGATVGASGNNTITQFLTSQLSLMASDYLNSRLGNNNFISAIDFEIAVAQNTSLLGDDAKFLDGFFDVVPDEVQLNMRNQFKNDNFVLNLGGNYVRESQLSTAENYVTGDFSLDWYLTDDRRLKLRFYGNYDYDEAFTTRRQRYGFGINYRREFGSMTENAFQSALDSLIDEIQASDINSGTGSN